MERTQKYIDFGFVSVHYAFFCECMTGPFKMSIDHKWHVLFVNDHISLVINIQSTELSMNISIKVCMLI